MFGYEPQTNIRSTDRVLQLEVADNEAPLNSLGVVDKRLFTGNNNLHAVMDDQTMLWSMKYDTGNIPPPLRQKFTSFKLLLHAAQEYFKTRNIRIKEIKD